MQRLRPCRSRVSTFLATNLTARIFCVAFFAEYPAARGLGAGTGMDVWSARLWLKAYIAVVVDTLTWIYFRRFDLSLPPAPNPGTQPGPSPTHAAHAKVARSARGLVAVVDPGCQESERATLASKLDIVKVDEAGHPALVVGPPTSVPSMDSTFPTRPPCLARGAYLSP